MRIVLAILAAYVLGYPVFCWLYRELHRYPRHMWTGFGNPHPWRKANVVSFALLGVPVFIVATLWRGSRTRRGLRELGAQHRVRQ